MEPVEQVDQIFRRVLKDEPTGTIRVTDNWFQNFDESIQVIDVEIDETQVIDFDALQQRLLEGATSFERSVELEVVS
jgi:hypothetical protein